MTLVVRVPIGMRNSLVLYPHGSSLPRLSGSELTSLVTTNDTDTSQRFHTGQFLDDGVAFGHTKNAKGESDGDYDGETFGNGGDGEGDCCEGESGESGNAESGEGGGDEREAMISDYFGEID